MNTITKPEEINTTQVEKKVVYAAKAHTTGGRDGGASRTSDGRLDENFHFRARPATAPIRSNCLPLAGPPVSPAP
jgi:hypothetical protein